MVAHPRSPAWRHSDRAQLLRLSAGEGEMDDATGGADGLQVESPLEFLEPVPEPLPPAQNNGHDDYVHVVDQVGGEELSDSGRTPADADIETARGLLGNLQGLSRTRVDEVDVVPPFISIEGPGVVGRDKYRRMERRVVTPPAPPLFVSPRSALRSELSPAHDLDTDARAQMLAKASSIPVLPAGEPCVSWMPRNLRVGKNHSWSR